MQTRLFRNAMRRAGWPGPVAVGLALLASLLAIGPTLLSAQEFPAANLNEVVSADMQADPRDQFDCGDQPAAVQWQAGSLTLGPGGEIARELEAGYGVELEFDLALKPRASGNRATGWRMDLRLTPASDRYLLFSQRETDGAIESSIALHEMPREGASPDARPRQVALARLEGPLADGVWRIGYRLGLWTVDPPGPGADDRLLLYKADTVDSVDGFSLKARSADLAVRRLAVRAMPDALARMTEAQREQLARAERLNAEVVSLYRAGRHSDALPLAEEAAGLWASALGDRHWKTGLGRFNVAAQLKPLGRLDEADAIYREVVGRYRAELGDEHPLVLDQLNDLAILCQTRNQYDEARSLLSESMALAKRIHGLPREKWAATALRLGQLLEAEGQYATAEPLLREAIAIARGSSAKPNLLLPNGLNHLGNLLVASGRYAEAEGLLVEARDLFKQAVGARHEHYASSVNNLAVLYQAVGRLDEAEPLYLETRRLIEEQVGTGHASYGLALNNLGHFYAEKGDRATAEPLFRAALKIFSQRLGADHPLNAAALNNLGLCLEAVGDPEGARQNLTEAIDTLARSVGRQHPDHAASINNLADVELEAGNVEAAERLVREAITVWEAAVGTQHPDYARGLGSLGHLHRQRNELAAAVEAYGQARQILLESLGARHPRYAQCQNWLGLAHEASGEVVAAEECYRSALEVFTAAYGAEHPDTVQTLGNLALLRMKAGDFEQAADLLRQTLAATSREIDAASVVQNEQTQRRFALRLRYRLDSYISLALKHPPARERLLDQLLLWKGATHLRQAGYRRLASVSGAEDLLGNLRDVAARLAAHWREDSSMPGWHDSLNALLSERFKLEQQLGRASAEASASLGSTAHVTGESLRKALPADAVLVDYHEFTHRAPDPQRMGEWISERRLMALVVRSGKTDQLFDLGPVAPLHAAIADWRESAGLTAESHAAGALLRERIWTPLLEQLDGAHTVLVSPDGELGRMAFAALPGRRPGSWLLEDHRLAIIPVPAWLPQLMNEPRVVAPRTLLVAGDIAYGQPEPAGGGQTEPEAIPINGVAALIGPGGDRGGTDWGPLEGSRMELARLIDQFRRLLGVVAASDQVLELRGLEASEARFLEAAPSYRFIHLATHGFFAPEHVTSWSGAATGGPAGDVKRMMSRITERSRTVPGFSPGQLSGLVFAGANRRSTDPANDGYVSADEIGYLQLAGTELVVLSACETGLGSTAGGEGLLGLQQAFQVAGARSVIATLWAVDDRHSAELMDRFYSSLLNSDPALRAPTRLDALRDAQLAMLRNERSGRGGEDVDAAPAAPLDPRHWAGWVLSGDWR